MPNCKTIIARYLAENDYDGLANGRSECGCSRDDIAPCDGGPYPECETAKRRVLGDKEYMCYAIPGDVVYEATDKP